MMKKILSLILAALFCMTCAVGAFAADDVDYVVDEIGYLESDEIEMLNGEAEKVYDARGVGVFFVYTYTEDIVEMDISQIVGDLDDYVVMVENEELWYLHLGGIAVEAIDAEAEEALRASYDDEMTYRAGVSAFIAEVERLLPTKVVDDDDTAATEDADKDTSEDVDQDDVTTGAVVDRLFDGADLLTDAEEEKLGAKLDKISEKYEVDVAVATVDGTGDMTVDAYVEYYFDNSGLGYGPDRDGVLLLVDMDSREFRVLSNGKKLGAAAISSDDIDSITEKITEDLSDGNYADAFHTYADECEYQIDGHINGFPFNFGMNLLISLGIGLVLAFIITGVMKGKLKSVRSQYAAASYVKAGSLMVTESRDRFLYSRVTCEEKESKSSDDDSGPSRNVGGGSF